MARNCMNVGMSQSIAFEYSGVVYCLFMLSISGLGVSVHGLVSMEGRK